MHPEIRRRALRAAAAVSLTFGVVGCGAEVEIATGTGSTGSTGSTQANAGGASGAGGASATGGAGGAPVADAGVDAAIDCATAADYTACCTANHWKTAAGCTPWGPPMPPAMTGVA